MGLILLSLIFPAIVSCASAPKFKRSLVRPWETVLDKEAFSNGPFVAHHRRWEYELFYLAANHDNQAKSETHRLVHQLFQDQQFNFLLIEPISNTTGESPAWFVEESIKGTGKDIVLGGEAATAVLLADEKKIPFAGGEIDDKILFNQLKALNYSNEDILGFYLARRIPQWVRENIPKNRLVEKMGPGHLAHYCKVFEIQNSDCPDLRKIQAWYKLKSGKTLDSSIQTGDVAPIFSSSIFTQQISSDIGQIRDQYTLRLIEDYLKKYKKIAVIYGRSHYLTLKLSFEEAMGVAQFKTPDLKIKTN